MAHYWSSCIIEKDNHGGGAIHRGMPCIARGIFSSYQQLQIALLDLRVILFRDCHPMALILYSFDNLPCVCWVCAWAKGYPALQLLLQLRLRLQCLLK